MVVNEGIPVRSSLTLTSDFDSYHLNGHALSGKHRNIRLEDSEESHYSLLGGSGLGVVHKFS